MTIVVRLILAGFAVYRVAELLVIDDGPYFIFRRFRRWLGQNAAGSDTQSFEYMLAGLFGCPFCIGVWLAALAVVPVMLPTVVTDVILIWLALAGFQTLLESKAGVHK